MTDNLLYQERLSSNRTAALFVGLTLLFGLLFVWRVSAVRLDLLAIVLLVLGVFFLFYVLNYRTLAIRLTAGRLKLTFGLLSWTVPLDNVAECRLDALPTVMRLGGAGIHFMMIRKRYRASFNFLEYPRVVIALKRKVGPVQDISFSTRRPDEVIRLMQEAAAARSSG